MRRGGIHGQCLVIAGWAIGALAFPTGAQAQLSASPSSLNFSNCQVGTGNIQQTLNINSSAGPINFTVATGVNLGSGWLSISPTSAVAPASLTARVNTNLVPVGPATGFFLISYVFGGVNRQFAVNVNVNCQTEPPQLFSLDPPNVPPGLTFVLTIVGSNFQNGVVVYLNGQSLSTTRDSEGQVRATVPGGLIANPGVYTVTAQNPGSPLSNSLGIGVGPIGQLVTSAPAQGVSFSVPVNTVTVQTLSFTYAASDGSNRAVSIQAQSGGWLSVEASSNQTPGSAQVRANPAGLAAGNYSGSITLVSPTLANSPVVIPVTLTVTNVINLSANPAQVNFAAQPGGAPQTASVSLASGGALLPFLASAQSAGGWLTVSPGSGTTPTTLTVTVSPGQLAAGVYNGSVQVTSVSAANSPLSIPVTLTVGTANSLNVNPPSLSFSAAAGQNPAPQPLSVTSTTSGLAFSVTSNAAWLSAGSGSTPASVPVSVNTAGLAPGQYTAALSVSAAGATNSPVTVNVTLTVSQAQAPSLLAQPGSLSLSAQAGANASAAISVTSSGAVLTFAASAGAPWLSVQTSSNTTPANVTVAANAATLSAGAYNAAITLAAQGAANSPVTVPVTFTVTGAALPTLSVSQNPVNFTLVQGGNPQAQTIAVTSSGAALSYTSTVSPGANWLAVSGGGSAPGPLTLTANPAGLAPGAYAATVTLNAAGAANSPVTLHVNLTVTSGATPALSAAPQALSLTAAVGGPPVSQNVTITSSGAQVAFAAAATAGWLSVSAPGGTTPATLAVTANAAGLAAGEYSAALTVTAQGTANSPLTITVRLTVSASGARPAVSRVENGASFADVIAPASWITIRGANLSPVTREIRSDEFTGGRRPTQAEGVSVQVNNRPAFLHYLSPTQLNVVSPDDDAVGPVTVTVTVNGQTSASYTANLRRVAPAFFLWPDNQVVATSVDFQLRARNGTFPGAATKAAAPGEVIIVWGSGFGAVSPPVPAGAAAAGASLITGTLRVTVGGVETIHFGAALAPGFTALFQLAIQIPPDAPDGELPVIATVDGVASPANAVISVRR